MAERPPARLARVRAAAQLLHRPERKLSPAELAGFVGGIQAQDVVAGRLGFRARDTRLRAADVDRARNEEGSLIRTWVMRDTMHLLAADDAHWLLPLFEPRLAQKSRARLGTLGMEEAEVERALSAVRKALGDGPLRRSAAVEAIERTGIELDEQRKRNLIHNATVSGLCIQGPDDGARQTLVDRREWLPRSRERFDRDAAIRELTVRYLRAFAPATVADLAGWSSLGLADVRSGLAALAPKLREERVGGELAFSLKRAGARAGEGVVRLLPAFDNYLMGHRDREFIAPGNWPLVMPGGGILRPTLISDGVALGTWSIRRSAKRLDVTVKPFAPLGRSTREALELEVGDLGRFEGVEGRLLASQ